MIARTGHGLVIELADHRLVAIHPLEPADDDPIIDELLESSEPFRRLVARSKAGPGRPFPGDA